MREGWGLTKYLNNGVQEFYATDGSNGIFVIDPSNWNVKNTIYVTIIKIFIYLFV